jgi:hypothetical protein
VDGVLQVCHSQAIVNLGPGSAAIRLNTVCGFGCELVDVARLFFLLLDPSPDNRHPSHGKSNPF